MNLITWSLGEKGADLIADSDPHTGTWCAFSVVNDCVFASIDDPTLTVYGTLSSITFPAGYTSGGGFKGIQLTSGAVWAYKALK